MAHVPVSALSLCTLRGEDDLITGLAARAKAFGMVTTAVDLAHMVEVDEVHQQLPACGAHKALGVPAGTQSCSAGKHCDVPTSNLLPTLLTDGPSDGHWEDAHSATAQVLPFPLLAEGSELFLLLLYQCRAVLCLRQGGLAGLLPYCLLPNPLSNITHAQKVYFNAFA